MPTIAVYDWSVVSHDGALTAEQLTSDDHANDPASENYDPGRASWTGVTYTYTGAPPVQIVVSDDDGSFDDGMNDTGAGQVLMEPVTVNGVTYPAGTPVENEFALIQDGFIEVYVLRLGDDNIGFVPASDLPEPFPGAQFSPTASRDGLAENSGDGGTNEEAYNNVICFGAGVRIATPGGDVRAGALRAGDMVLTVDHGPQALIWTGRREVVFSGPDDRRRPVRIGAGALGEGQPGRDVLVSPQHRVLVGEGCGPGSGALGPALGLMRLPGVSRVRGRQKLTYVHLLLARHELLWADGLVCESFFPGRMALRLLGAEDRAEVLALWGLSREGAGPERAARPLLTRRETAARVDDGMGRVLGLG